jgi:hypothetical protein
MSSLTLQIKTPYVVLLKMNFICDKLKVLGCQSYVKKLQVKNKFDVRSIRSVFLGYPLAQKGYKLYDLDKKKIFVSKDVIFHEFIFPFKPHIKSLEQDNEVASPPSNDIVNDTHAY